MIKFFLNAKHWQLFVLFFAIPLLVQLSFQMSMMSTFSILPDEEPDFEKVFEGFETIMFWMPIIIAPTLIGFFGWLWSISVGLHHKLPESHGLNLTLFKVMVILSLITLLIIFILAKNLFGEIFLLMENEEMIEDMTEMPSWVMQAIIIVPLSLISTACMIYSLYHSAKTLKLVETGDSSRKSDFIGEFVMLWFYYIGVWFIQPKVNKMAADDFVSNINKEESLNRPYEN